MKKSVKIAAAAAGGVAIVALGVGTATAATVNFVRATDDNGYGMHQGSGEGQHLGRMGGGAWTGQGHMGNDGGSGMGAMSGLNLSGVASGTLTDDQKATLASMADEEKLAHDVYVTLGEKYPDLQQFSHIQNAETRHLEAVRTLLERYGVADPTAGEAAGTFSDARFQDLYSQLIAGASTPQAALDAGVKVEQTDIADLEAARASVTSAPDVTQVYDALISGSQRHLAAFSR